MEFKKFTITAAIFTFILLESQLVSTHIAKPPVGVTGAPMEKTCYQPDQPTPGCHATFPLNTGPGNVAITFSGGSQYVPGTVYQVTFTVTQTGLSRFGFEGTALDGQDKGVGTFSVQDTSKTSLQNGFLALAGRQYVGHKDAWKFVTPNSDSWTVNWQAPVAADGNVTFYACGNATNSDSTPKGDEIYHDSLIVAVSTGIEELSTTDNDFQVKGNIVSQRMQIAYHLNTSENVRLTLISLDGKTEQELFSGRLPGGNSTQEIHLSPYISKGLYILNASFNGLSKVQKIIIQ